MWFPLFLFVSPEKVDKKVDNLRPPPHKNKQKWIKEKWILILYTAKCARNKCFDYIIQLFYMKKTSLNDFEHLLSSSVRSASSSNILSNLLKKTEEKRNEKSKIIYEPIPLYWIGSSL